jgi:hypothetical protein
MTCTLKSVCDQMASETDRDILLCYYNKLADNLKTVGYTNKTENDEACKRTLAAKMLANLQTGLDQKTSMEMHADMMNLVTTEEDSSVLSNMKRSHALFWLILMCIVLLIVIYLWNFK